MNWFAIHTKPRKERFVTDQLKRLSDVEVLNPIVKVKKFYRKKLVFMEEGLFPSYIFARFDLDRYYNTVRYTRGTRRILGSKFGTPYIVDDFIITEIKERIKDGFVRLDPPDLKKGDNVYIRYGPMAGFIGVFLSETKPSERVTILLNTIAFQGKVEIEKYHLVKT